MPGAFSFISGHHHRPTTSSSSADHYSKSDKSRKNLHYTTPKSLFLLSALCFLVFAGGITFSLFVVLRPKELPTFRCGRVEDTFRSVYFPSSTNTGGVSDRPKLLGFVGIQTGFSSRDRREALRSTWFPSDADGLLRMEQATGLAFRFVIGRAREAYKMAELEKEIQKYNDFMLIDVEEEYLKLPYKTLAYFKAAYKLFDADYYVKADDDIYLRPDRLATLLAKERAHPMTYIGCMKRGPVITDPKYKWYEKSGRLIGNNYFLHAYGPIYILSAEVVASIAVTRNNSMRMFNNEDVTIGSWMLAMNVHHEDNRAICDPRCTPTSIAVWDIPKCSEKPDVNLISGQEYNLLSTGRSGLCNPAIRMKVLHSISMCSKSPTLPPDDR